MKHFTDVEKAQCKSILALYPPGLKPLWRAWVSTTRASLYSVAFSREDERLAREVFQANYTYWGGRN